MRIPSHFLLPLPSSAQLALISGARDSEHVRGLTHGFYKYPARFSPAFVRAAIETFTRPGDMVLDNHVGGGTTLVESLALGRHSIGVDISELAQFVSTVKSTIFSKNELNRLSTWVEYIDTTINIQRSSAHLDSYAALGYYKHLDHPSRWRLRKAIEQGLEGAMSLDSPRLESFGRCVVLRTGQWALDGRRTLPSIGQFRQRLKDNAREMLVGARELLAAVRGHYPIVPTAHIINRSAAGLEDDAYMLRRAAPALVITSPPYPGVHVLYHRWQVDGRKEAPLPFMIANKLDGAGSSYYTMGDRKDPQLKAYFDKVQSTMASVASLASEETIIVQMVAFSDQRWQLGRYLETMEAAGLEEVALPMLQDVDDGRLWRSVPNRRWYSDQRGETPGSQEVVLFHRKRPHVTAHRPARQLNELSVSRQ